jgi:hypothetical protein
VIIFGDNINISIEKQLLNAASLPFAFLVVPASTSTLALLHISHFTLLLILFYIYQL